MSNATQLARGFARRQPDAAAHFLDTADRTAAATILANWPPELAVTVICRMVPAAAAVALAAMPAASAATIAAAAGPTAAATVLRPLPETALENILAAMPTAAAQPLRTVLSHPEDTAAAVMRADVLAISADRTVAEALAVIRADIARLAAFLYVVDDNHHLLGLVPVRGLLTTAADTGLRELMGPPPAQLYAGNNFPTILKHPGWRVLHELPVVKIDGTLLGVIDYQTMRQLETGGHGVSSREAGQSTASALGDLFSVGVYGVLEGAFGGPQAKPKSNS